MIRSLTMPIHNPARLPAQLWPAEQQLVSCLSEGIPCLVGNQKRPSEQIIESSDSGKQPNAIRGEVIRFFVYGGDYHHPVRGTNIVLKGAWISDDKDALNLIHMCTPYALNFERCHFDVLIRAPRMECAALYLDGSLLRKGLWGDGLAVTGSVRMGRGFRADRKVRLVGANIGGNLDCGGGEFNMSDEEKGEKNALNAERVKTGGHVYLNKRADQNNYSSKDDLPFVAHGKVRLPNADIGGNLNCKGGQFHNRMGDNAISASGLKTRGAVFLSHGFVAHGEVQLHVAQIGGNFVCIDCDPNEGEKSVINLESSTAAAVHDSEESWEPFQFRLDGFSYDRFFDAAKPICGETRCKWLRSRPDDVPFSPLPYEQAAKALFGMGRAADARHILLEKQRLEATGKTSSRVQKVLDYIENMAIKKLASMFLRMWDTVGGYGYRPVRTFLWALFVVCLGAGIFWYGDKNGRIIPHQPVVLASPKYQYGRIPSETPTATVKRKFPGYPEFSPFWFSLDIFVPLFNLHQEPFWYPAPDGGRPHWWPEPKNAKFSFWGLLEIWYWIQIGAGWVLTSLFLLSVTGLLRPRQSGEKG